MKLGACVSILHVATNLVCLHWDGVRLVVQYSIEGKSEIEIYCQSVIFF